MNPNEGQSEFNGAYEKRNEERIEPQRVDMSRGTVDIRPGVSVLAVLRHLNYKPWFALAEFVDNSVQSFLANRDNLFDIHGDTFSLRVNIDVEANDPPRISIRDNAAGIDSTDYSRAFRPAAIPPDRSGLAEFGMGMKSAACWFAPNWTVRTSALGESVARTIDFHIANIVHDNIQELAIDTAAEEVDAHYTEIVLEDVFHAPVGRTIHKIKEHLTDIYRVFIRENTLELFFNGEKLSYSEPTVLRAPFFRDPDGDPIEWRKDINFDFGRGMSVHGFAGIRETANTAQAGFSLFRRKRLIEGSGDEGYRPKYIFGSSNSFRYQRVFGELHLEGFDVSHTKDGFRWDENEQPFLELLREGLDGGELPLLRQAEGHRVRPARSTLTEAGAQAMKGTIDAMRDRLPDVLASISEYEAVETDASRPESSSRVAHRSLAIHFRDQKWLVHVELSDDPAESQWLVVSDAGATAQIPREISIRLSLVHPFMVRFAHSDAEDIEALLRIAAALSVAEIVARDSGVRLAGTIRRNVNDILRGAFSAP